MKEELEKRFPDVDFDFHTDVDADRQYFAIDGEMIGTSWGVSDIEVPAVKEAILEGLITFVENHIKIHG